MQPTADLVALLCATPTRSLADPVSDFRFPIWSFFRFPLSPSRKRTPKTVAVERHPRRLSLCAPRRAPWPSVRPHSSPLADVRSVTHGQMLVACSPVRLFSQESPFMSPGSSGSSVRLRLSVHTAHWRSAPGRGICGGVRSQILFLRGALGRNALHCSRGDALQYQQPGEQHRPCRMWLPERSSLGSLWET